MATVNYKVIKNFFNQDELNILQKYCYNKLDTVDNHNIGDIQSFSPSWYHDSLMTSLFSLDL